MRVLSAWIALGGVFALLLLLPGQAGAVDRCEVCGRTTATNYFSMRDKIRLVKKLVCEQCQLPIFENKSLNLGEGRLLCEEDAKLAVMDETVAADIYNEVKEEVRRILANWPPVPDRGITVHLVNRRDFVKECRKLPRDESAEHLLGLTVSRRDRDDNWDHQIYLLNGLFKAQLMAVCAHETTHVWLYEHEQPARTLHKDATEGFCEFIAHKYMSPLGYTNETRRIQENTYSRGQIGALLKAEEHYQSYRIINWVINGVDSWLDPDQPERVLALRADTTTGAPERPFALPVVAPPPPGAGQTHAQRRRPRREQTLRPGEQSNAGGRRAGQGPGWHLQRAGALCFHHRQFRGAGCQRRHGAGPTATRQTLS